MRLSKNDIDLIAKQINLSPPKALSLLEEEGDLDLVLDQVCESYIDSQTVRQFSFPVFCKFLILKYSKDTTYDLSEKMCVAKQLADQYARLKDSIDVRILENKSLSELGAFYYLFVSGLFNTRLHPKYFNDNHLLRIEYGFKNAELRGLAGHVADWIIILRKIQQDGWFLKPKQKMLKLCN